MKTYKFKSIQVNNVEKHIGNTGMTRMEMEFDMESVRDHSLDLDLRMIITDRAWVPNFFLTFMIISAIFALAYGILSAGFNVNFSGNDGSSVLTIYISLLIISFLGLWTLLSIPGAVKNRKKKLVDNERGKGTWKIIDENKWDRFYRLLTIKKGERD